MLIWRLAFRNLFRQRGRLILNLILLVGGICTIICFKGFKTHILKTIQDLVVDSQFGHIQVAKKAYWENTPVDIITDKMIENPSVLVSKISKIPGVRFVSPRLEFYGLVNNNEQSASAHFIGLQPDVEYRAQSSVLFLEGTAFTERTQSILSRGLKNKLRVKNGDVVTVLAPTFSGSINAMDLSVSGIFTTGFSSIDNGTIYLSLLDAQKILDSSHAEKLLININDETQLERIASDIRYLLENSDLVVKGWKDVGELYTQVENFYILQNIVIEIIIISLLFLCVANTVSMTVFERLAEIGTLRALGDDETQIQNIFFVESLILGVLAIIIAIPVSLAIVQVVKSLNLTILLPLASRPMPVLLHPTLDGFLEASLTCLFSVMLASIWPARKGARVSIVAALGAKV